MAMSPPFGGSASTAGSLTPEQFGAVGGGANDTVPIRDALLASIAQGKRLRFTQPLAWTQISNTGSGAIHIEFGDYVHTVTPPNANGALVLSSPQNTNLALGTGIARYGTVLGLVSTATVTARDLIAVDTTIVSENDRGRYRRCVFSVIAVINGTDVLVNPSNFPFASGDAGLVVRHFPAPRKVELSRPKFILTTATGTVYRGVYLGGCRAPVVTDLDLDAVNVTDVNTSSDGIMLDCCWDGLLVNPKLRRLRYGIVPTQSNNTRIKEARSDECRHAVSPAYWSEGVFVDGLEGENNIAIADSHEAFNVNYNRVRTTSDQEASNIRSIGGSFTNSDVRSVSTSFPNQFQNIGLATGDNMLYENRDFTVRDVKWHAPSGFGVDQGRRVTIDGLVLTNGRGITLGAAIKSAHVNMATCDFESGLSVFSCPTQLTKATLFTGRSTSLFAMPAAAQYDDPRILSDTASPANGPYKGVISAGAADNAGTLGQFGPGYQRYRTMTFGTAAGDSQGNIVKFNTINGGTNGLLAVAFNMQSNVDRTYSVGVPPSTGNPLVGKKDFILKAGIPRRLAHVMVSEPNAYGEWGIAPLAGTASSCIAWNFDIIRGTDTDDLRARIGALMNGAHDPLPIQYGTAAPATTPQYTGQRFIDTTAGKEYVAKGIASSADWVILN